MNFISKFRCLCFVIIVASWGCGSPNEPLIEGKGKWIRFYHVAEIVDSLTEEIAYEAQEDSLSMIEIEILDKIIARSGAKSCIFQGKFLIERWRCRRMSDMSLLDGQLLQELQERGIQTSPSKSRFGNIKYMEKPRIETFDSCPSMPYDCFFK